MNKFLTVIISCLVSISFAQKNAPYTTNATYTFDEATTRYQELAKAHAKSTQFIQFGSSDYGKPIGLFVMNRAGDFTKEAFKNKSVLLINNAIHPGEPCGVDACIKLAEDLLDGKNKLPKNVIIAIIPVYNVGGAHNRNCCTRANQNGPVEYGFRGNSKNLDLNRDFIKCDSKNSRTFHEIFHFLNPSVFIDTHTSNGADYQHVMTFITSQLNKMNPALRDFTKNNLNPYLYESMANQKYPMVPYVHTVDGTPDNGIMDYLETPRYSTGYTNLFNTISYVTEAHMLKPYEQRVLATYAFLNNTINYMDENHKELELARSNAEETLRTQTWFDINWAIDKSKFDTIPFLGYTARYKPSKVTGSNRLYYDREQPYSKFIKYYNNYAATDSVSRPNYYIIPQAWDNVISLLKLNNVPIFQLLKDEEIPVEQYEIKTYDTKKVPYEGHYLHYNITTSKRAVLLKYRKGDYVIPTNNNAVRFIIETLEPRAADSYFAWNYFDATLQQKEWFSAYVFEDEAARILDENPLIKGEFEEKRRNDSTFAKSDFAQLYWVYKKSPNYEGSTNIYPITRCMQELPTHKITNLSVPRNFKGE